MVTRVVLSLHDQATELRYPERLHPTIDLMFGGQAGEPDRRPGRAIAIEETGPDRYGIKGSSKPRLDGLSLPELLDALLDEVVHSLIDGLDTAVALHAASVGWGGKSLLIAGLTGAGKTSLAGWLVANGFEFLSDELVVLTDTSGTIASFPRPLLAKPGAQELIALLARSGCRRTVSTAENTVICLDRPTAEQSRQAGLILFPHYVAGSALELASSSPAMTGMRLMECNLNARNLPGHGFPTLSAFARNVPALALTYGSFAQLDGVLDRLARFILEGNIDPSGLEKLVSAFRPRDQGRSAPAAAPAVQKFPIPSPTPRKPSKKLTIGMATYDDYDGVYFTLQALRLYHPEILDETEFLVIDNHPDGACAQHLKNLENAIPSYRYLPKGEQSGTAVRDWIFQEAGGDFVLCMDCHVFVVPGALKRLIDYFDAHPDTGDLLQGPLLYDNLTSISTHFRPEWRKGMYGVWEKSDAGADIDAAPFDIPMQGLGLFACRRAAWPGFNPDFRGFGGEEGYIHEKFRRAGGRTLCLPFLRWMHRFTRPLGVPYANRWEDRLRNYLIGFRELGLDTAPVTEHFRTHLGEAVAPRVLAQVEKELPANTRHAISKDLSEFLSECRAILAADSRRNGLEEIRRGLERLIGKREFVAEYFGDDVAPANRLIHEDKTRGFRFLTHILPAAYASPPHDHGKHWVIYAQVSEHSDVTEWTRAQDAGAAGHEPFRVAKRYRLVPGDVRIFQEGAIHSIDCPAGTRYVRVQGLGG